MKTKHAWIALFCLCSSFCGCVTITVEGNKFYTSDYAVTSVDASFDNIWRVAVRQLENLGKITESKKEQGLIRAVVQEAAVKVEISKLSERTMHLRVSARRHLLPDEMLAESILSSIIRNL